MPEFVVIASLCPRPGDGKSSATIVRVGGMAQLTWVGSAQSVRHICSLGDSTVLRRLRVALTRASRAPPSSALYGETSEVIVASWASRSEAEGGNEAMLGRKRLDSCFGWLYCSRSADVPICKIYVILPSLASGSSLIHGPRKFQTRMLSIWIDRRLI